MKMPHDNMSGFDRSVNNPNDDLDDNIDEYQE